MNLQDYGNTSSASIPILLNELNREGVLKKGQKLVLAGLEQDYPGEQRAGLGHHGVMKQFVDIRYLNIK